MGFLNYKQPKRNISFRSDYRKATFGLFHVAFLDNNNQVLLPQEDKESIQAVLDFYHSRILKRENYPVYDGTNFVLKPSDEKEVLNQVLGLPEEVFLRLDIRQEILPQLRFASNLADLKRECYVMLSKSNNRKWFSDDFKLYCLKKGFFFLYDETKPFIERDDIHLPVFIDEKRLEPKYKKLYDEANSTRLAIDFLGQKDDSQFNLLMRKLDDFSFDRRLSYFINGDADLMIDNCQMDLSFKRKYAFLLREYFASLINVLYDDYCFEVLHKVTAKLSFMSISKTYTNRDIYSVSSFNADMYSFDQQEYFFAVEDHKEIKHLLEDAMEKNPAGDILTIYAHAGLPYEGYQCVKDLQVFSVDDIMQRFTFKVVSSSEIYLSSKRYDTFYSYLSGEKEHRYAFLLRLLLDSGIQYLSDKPLLVDNKENKITITSNKGRRLKALARLFDRKKGSFKEEIFSAYLLENKMLEDSQLASDLEKIDQQSHMQALPFFFHAFKQNTLANVINQMFVAFDIQDIKMDHILSFMNFCLLYPLLVAEQEYRVMAIDQGDTLSLLVLDGLPKLNESYEPNMPYPYVTYGKIAYSFRESYFSKPYICSCQKNAIASKIEYFMHLYDRYHPEDFVGRNNYVLSQLGLPDNILTKINPTRDVLSQIPFKKNLCHCCQHSIPSYHESVDNNEEERHNTYFTYIRARSALHGVYFNETMHLEYDLGSFFEELNNKTYHALLHIDRNRIKPILLPYVNISKDMIVSLLSAFFPNDISYDDFYNEVTSFLALGENTIRRLLFDCSPEDYTYIYQHMMVFTRLVYLYKMIEISYAFYVSEDITPRTENEFTLNLDYNPNLPYPYILLGSGVNAYASSLTQNHYYLCASDKPAMLSFAKRYSTFYDQRNMDASIKTPIILGLLGLPYLVILKYASFDLSSHSIEELFQSMEFKSGICRRDLNIAHASYDEPFRLAFPFKEDMQSDYNFAAAQMMREGFKVISDYPLIDIKFRVNYHYDLDAYVDSNLPLFDYCTDSIPEPLFTFFAMSHDALKNYLVEFSKLNMEHAEANAYASSIILDTYFRNDKTILNFVFDLSSDKTLREEVMTFFPEIDRVRGSYQNIVIQQILGFISYLIQQLFYKYALKESYIGR